MGLKPSPSHGKRLITASLIIPLLFLALYFGGPVLFIFLVWAGFSLGNREWFYLIYQKPSGFILWLHWFLGSLALWGAYFKGIDGLFLALILGALFCFIYMIVTFPNQKPFFDSLGKQIFALWYLPLYLPFFVLIRKESHGLNWVFFLLAVNYAGDTAAYYVGRTWGRHKLAPLISPQKTIEGSLGGLTANILLAWIFQVTLFPQYPQLQIIGLGLLLGMVSQLGDLLESMFKRTVRVKDSGSLFPGHGGFLDRADSVLLPAPLVYFFVRFFG
ncbi:MAG: phosphatidate cytidylyltransferase [Deltaproteobacteria bacterium]|nr:phosphatidate cytidylyltransferase [Deltaproteobacteria bacterium]